MTESTGSPCSAVVNSAGVSAESVLITAAAVERRSVSLLPSSTTILIVTPSSWPLSCL